jgi:hypothetical protein
MGTALCCNRRREGVSSKSSSIARKPRSINDLPDEIILKILSYFGPEELIFNIAEVCEKWNALSRDVTLWKETCYSCDQNSDISRVFKVRCAVMLGFRANYLMNFASLSEIGPDVRQVYVGLYCVKISVCYW